MHEGIMTEVKENMVKHAPSCLSVDPITSMFIVIKAAATQHCRNVALADAYMTMNAEFARYRLKAIQETHSNNWLRMHGYPMRRKCRKR